MKKTPSKLKATVEMQLLELVKAVLPRAIADPKLANRIYEAIEQEIKAKTRATAFEKFCGRVPLPDLEPKTLQEVKDQFKSSFDDADVTMKPNKKDQLLMVEIALPDGSQLDSEIKVRPADESAEDEEGLTLKYVPFPVCLPGDPELIWMLAKVETMTPEEAAIALAKVEEDFWGSKTGQKLIRDRVERTFAEFIARVPSGMLTEVGLKRHYKMPEPVKQLRAVNKSGR
jgi:hypothetical protein